ncbi:hypothetical protein ASD15_05050 [Massilia sp. Root351]|jgi:hypothetical protein|uniref:hypothetical protein n=1 Tax=Massilia sp. Root351 TaxID=1736522 RepID=UPI00070D1660|nr:hypothetical protein [Massilia sp. Root351]KQV91394.1 hypothetical protein ASD15_05050 [Massilia sp. Root351]
MTRSRPALLLTTLLHVALLAALLARQHAVSPVRSADREAITWILPAAPKARHVPGTVPAHAASSRAPGAIAVPLRPVPASAAASSEASTAAQPVTVTADTVPAALPSAPAAGSEPVIGDLSAQPAAPPMPAAELLRLTLYNAGKVDNELRQGKLAPLPPAKDTIRGKIDAAFEAAHQAVKPKWYEAAKVSEISAPGARTRVYQIRTALGTYCISMADPSSGGGVGGNSGPRYSNCP